MQHGDVPAASTHTAACRELCRLLGQLGHLFRDVRRRHQVACLHRLNRGFGRRQRVCGQQRRRSDHGVQRGCMLAVTVATSHCQLRRLMECLGHMQRHMRRRHQAACLHNLSRGIGWRERLSRQRSCHGIDGVQRGRMPATTVSAAAGGCRHAHHGQLGRARLWARDRDGWRLRRLHLECAPLRSASPPAAVPVLAAALRFVLTRAPPALPQPATTTSTCTRPMTAAAHTRRASAPRPRSPAPRTPSQRLGRKQASTEASHHSLIESGDISK